MLVVELDGGSGSGVELVDGLHAANARPDSTTSADWMRNFLMLGPFRSDLLF